MHHYGSLLIGTSQTTDIAHIVIVVVGGGWLLKHFITGHVHEHKTKMKD